jgi:hypothetical protein
MTKGGRLTIAEDNYGIKPVHWLRVNKNMFHIIVQVPERLSWDLALDAVTTSMQVCRLGTWSATNYEHYNMRL